MAELIDSGPGPRPRHLAADGRPTPPALLIRARDRARDGARAERTTGLAAVAWGASSRRAARHANEDRWAATPSAFVIADGMGGHQNGAVAATVAVDTFVARLAQAPVTPASLSSAVEAANTAVRRVAARAPGLAGMGCTLCAAVIADGRLLIANVGDSRLYRLRDGGLLQLTEDDSVLGRLAAEGLVSLQSAGARQVAGALTRCIGGGDTVDEGAAVDSLRTADRLILTSDGVHTAMTPDALAALAALDGPAEAAAALVQAAAGSGQPRDDATAIVVDIGERPIVSAAGSRRPRPVLEQAAARAQRKETR